MSPEESLRLTEPAIYDDPERLYKLQWKVAQAKADQIKWCVVGLILILLPVAWAFRWETLYAGKDSAYVMNRWTGETRWLVGSEWHPVGMSRPTGPWGTNDPPAK